MKGELKANVEKEENFCQVLIYKFWENERTMNETGKIFT